jgi:hypothetical protein
MKIGNRGAFANGRVLLAAASMAITLAVAMDAVAQVPPAEVEKLVKYAQCIRANGYPQFPDPGPDGRMQLRLDPKNGAQFEAAQRACKDQLPRGLAAMNQEMTPERLQAMLGFAQCMRGKGLSEFPDPSSTGVFEIASPTLDLSTPQAQQAAKACMASNPIGGLMIRRAPPK